MSTQGQDRRVGGESFSDCVRRALKRDDRQRGDCDPREHHRVGQAGARDQAKISNLAAAYGKLLRVKCVVGDNARRCIGSIASRSNTELTTDSRHRQVRANNKTETSCGTTSPLKSQALPGSSTRSFSIEHHSAAIVAPLLAHALEGLRCAEFISVSGQCAARSALSSDQRKSKRFSGGVAATEHLHAPMNSPSWIAALRVSNPHPVARH